MSIGIYSFLRIIFNAIARPFGRALSDTLRRQFTQAAVLICPAWPVWYRVQTGAACPASGSVCWCVAWVVLLPVLCSRSGCAVAGQEYTGGVYSRRPAPPGQCFNHRKNKKDPPHLHKTKPTRLCKSPNFPKNTKRPLSRSNLCYT